MDKMLYVAMSGARQVMLKQATNNHNLANVNTTGFKADIDNFKAMQVYGPGHPARVYSEDQRMGISHEPGPLMSTGMPLDIAVDGDGFIAVQDVDGSEAYTRNGHLNITEQGLLVNSAGYPVMGEAGPITLTAYNNVQIGTDGTITVMPVGQAGGEIAVLDRIKLVNPDTSVVERNERGLFTTPEIEPGDAEVTLATESLESSNVNAVDSLVTMIELSRQFETQVKLMGTAEENDSAADKLLRMS